MMIQLVTQYRKLAFCIDLTPAQFWSKTPALPQAAITAVLSVVTVLFIASLFVEFFEYLDAKTLEAISALGEDYLVGGIEYYEKLVSHSTS